MNYSLLRPSFWWQPTFLALLLGVSLLPSVASAYFPFFTDDTGTQGRGGHQVELSYGWSFDKGDEIDEDIRVIGSTSGIPQNVPLTYNYGMGKSVDIFFGVARQILPSGGWQNNQLGLKWVFYGDQKQGWSAAVKPLLIIPVTTAMQGNGLGTAKWNSAIALIASLVENRYEIHINAGYQSNLLVPTTDNDSQRDTLFNISVVPVVLINDAWRIGLDIGLQTNPRFDSNYQFNTGLGLVYSPVRDVQLGFGVFAVRSLRISTRQIGYAVTTGLTVQF